MSQATSAVVVGQNPIAEAVAAVLNGRNINTTVVTDLDAAMNCSASLLFPCWYPDPTVHTFTDLMAYPQKLMECGLQFGQRLADPSASTAIINFAFLPAIYVGTALEDYVSTLRGGITGVTRTLARKFGKQGLRVTGVQAGLVEMADTQAWVSEHVKKAPVPMKRWATPIEVAKWMVFLGADSTYTTGQTMIIDGGLTAGITGT